jgi:4-carboxymuconolactone decarboxylase
MNSDIYEDSGCRLPLVDRDSLDEEGRKAYDEAAMPGRSLAGLRGPAGIWLHSPGSLPHLRGLHRYLRFDSGISAAIREIAILVVARETNCQFQWVIHEPAALQAGVSAATVGAIKNRKSTEGLDEREAAVIELGRQAFGQHKVTSETFRRAAALFGMTTLVDIALLMGNASASSALLTIVDMQLRPGSEPPLPNS